MKRKLLLAPLIAGLAFGLVDTAYALNKQSSKQHNYHTKAIEANKVVSVYVLIDTDKDLDNFKNFVRSNAKLPFNRVLLSFLRPTFPIYEKDSLANTGMVGNFTTSSAQEKHAKDQFTELKGIIAELQKKNVSAFLSVGGWNYSCNYDVYKDQCGGSPTENHFDWFPDPTDPKQAQIATQSYRNLVDLAHDLGANGLDWDYEEFWHADAFADNWSTIANAGVWAQIPEDLIKNPTYNGIVNLNTGHVALDGKTAAIMDKTINKIDGILHAAID